MSKPTYDDLRAEATPCLGGCGKLCTHGPRYCRECEARRSMREDWSKVDWLLAERPDTEGGCP